MLPKLWKIIKEFLFGKTVSNSDQERILAMIKDKRDAAEKKLEEIEAEKGEIEDEKSLDDNIDYFNDK